MHKSEAIELFGGRVKLLADVLKQTRASVYLWPDELPEKTEFIVIGAAVKVGILELKPNEHESLYNRTRAETEDDEVRQMEEARRRAKISSFLRRGQAQKGNGQ